MKKKPVFIIAEAGVNHNGDMDIAKNLIDEAKKAGADAVKFQSFNADNLVTKSARQAEYQSKNIGFESSQYEMLKKLQLSEEQHFMLKNYCENAGVAFLSSAFCIDSARFLVNKCKLHTIKVGSGELTNAPFLYDMAIMGVNLILSTGMSVEQEIEEALGILSLGYFEKNTKPANSSVRDAYLKYKGRLKEKVSLLQCTTDYPCSPAYANLKAMDTLRGKFDCPVGFSDHTLGTHISLAAVARGAEIIEKHFTLSRGMQGPDHKASLEPIDLEKMVSDIRDIEDSIGSGELKLFPPEEKIKMCARKSLVASKSISKGEKFTEENITAKRPENGLKPILYWGILGKVADKDYSEDEVINYE